MGRPVVVHEVRRLGAWLLVAAALAGCASRGHYEPIPDPVDGRVYSCCWYPHGFMLWVPEP